MPDPNDNVPNGNNTNGNNGNGNNGGNASRARIAELERLLAERDATLVERERKLVEAQTAARTIRDQADAELERLRRELARLTAERDEALGATRARDADDVTTSRAEPVQRFRARVRLCVQLEGEPRTLAAGEEFVARRGDLEDDGFADGVDFELATPGR